jgi:hypothetical protein
MPVTIRTKNGTTGTPVGLADGELAVDGTNSKLWVGLGGVSVPLVGSGSPTGSKWEDVNANDIQNANDGKVIITSREAGTLGAALELNDSNDTLVGAIGTTITTLSVISTAGNAQLGSVTGEVQLVTDNINRVTVDVDGDVNLIGAAGPKRMVGTCFGSVNGVTGAIVQAGTEDWSAVRTGLGTYTLTFDIAALLSGSVTVSAFTGSAVSSSVANTSVTQTNVSFVNQDNNAVDVASFEFIRAYL